MATVVTFIDGSPSSTAQVDGKDEVGGPGLPWGVLEGRVEKPGPSSLGAGLSLGRWVLVERGGRRSLQLC